jgi:hypothetical protein
MTIPRSPALFARTLLTLCCLGGVAWMHALRPTPAEAQVGCSNGRCDGATLCGYRPGESCAFLDSRTCVTYRCKEYPT